MHLETLRGLYDSYVNANPRNVDAMSRAHSKFSNALLDAFPALLARLSALEAVAEAAERLRLFKLRVAAENCQAVYLTLASSMRRDADRLEEKASLELALSNALITLGVQLPSLPPAGAP